MWNWIETIDFINLANHYETVNLYAPRFELETRLVGKSVLCTLNNEIKIHYFHYYYDAQSSQIQTIGPDIFFADILAYAKEKWFERVSRSQLEPVFMFSMSGAEYELETYLTIVNHVLTHTNNVIVIVHKKSGLAENERVLVCDDTLMDENKAALAMLVKKKLHC